METSLFAPLGQLVSGILTGIVFGFLLRKGNVTRFNVIIGQLILKNFTVMKIILTAIAFGSAGIYLLTTFLLPYELIIASTTLFAALAGGGIFGIGMAVMGYCPGTGIAALADGAYDMWFGAAGMITGAALYAESYEWIIHHVKPMNQMTILSLPELFGISPLIIIGSIFLALYALSFLQDVRVS